jgi:hypothetical protein
MLIQGIARSVPTPPINKLQVMIGSRCIAFLSEAANDIVQALVSNYVSFSTKF